MADGAYFVEAVLVEGRSVSEVARTHGVSRRWIQKLLARYRAQGEAGLVPRSKAPKHVPRATSLEIEEAVVRLRKELADFGADCGAETIAHHLANQFDVIPSVRTIHRILIRRGQITPQPKKRPKASFIRFEASLPNECWQSDFTHWRLADGTGVEILTFLDDHTRLALSCVVYLSVTAVSVLESFRSTAAVYGLPASMLTDNGRVYTTSRYGTKVLIESELERHHITFKHGKPFHPQTQGKVERFQQTLKLFLAKQEPAESLEELQTQLDRFVTYYNEVRPHRALDRQTPRSVYDRKIKAHPKDNQGPGPDFRVRSDKVDKKGVVTLRYRSKLHHIHIGAVHRGTCIKLLIDDLDIRVITTDGELLRHFTLDPTRDYQPMNTGRVRCE